MHSRADDPGSAADHPLVRDLLRPENLPVDTDEVEFVSTHGSFVFLAGDSVFKVKRAKDYGFFDYSTLDARRHFCEEEVRLNRRTAPDVYLGVLPVYRDERGHSLTRPGEIVDHAVHMRRLPDEWSALAALQDGRLRREDLEAVARFVADFYSRVPPHEPDPKGLRDSIEENFEQAESFAGRLVSEDLLEHLRELQVAWYEKHEGLLATRTARDGHGDLRLEHVYFTESGPILIDCIEFLDRFRIADPALDVAFLAMELQRFRRGDLAESFLGSFARECGDYAFYPLADGYMSYRATVRAKVACFVADDEATSSARSQRKAAEADALFTLARELLARTRDRRFLIAVGGTIAAGKSTLAAALGHRLPAPVVTADRVRKQLAGIRPEERGGPELYEPAFTRRVQQRVLEDLRCVLESGRPALADTTCRSRRFRAELRRLADSCGAPFLMVECRVPESVARQRLRARDGGVSDAREDLLEPFLASWEPVDELPAGEHVAVDGSRPPDEVVGDLLRGPLAVLGDR